MNSVEIQETVPGHPLKQGCCMPNKHETLTLCWYNVGPALTTLTQHYTNIGVVSYLPGDLFESVVFRAQR